MVNGEAKTELFDIGNTRFRSNHAWNAVKINGEWYLLDATWGAGGVGDIEIKRWWQRKPKKKEVFVKGFRPYYFFTHPDTFFLKHFPQDTSMLLTARSYEDFSNLPLTYSEMLERGLMYTDSLQGVLWANYGDTISITLNGLYDFKDIEFRFNRERWDHSAFEARNVDGGFEFTFINPYQNGGYLIVYWRNVPYCAYRIKPMQ